MAQYKTFASQGSFNDFKITVPDETSKILEQGRQEAIGRQRVQRQVQANQNLLGQDMKAFSNLEQQLKASNYDLQSKERDQLRQSMRLDHDITMQNLRGEQGVRSEAPLPANLPQPKQQKALEDLSRFSKAASTLVDSFIKEQQKLDSANKNYIAMAAGLTYEDLASITKINQKLTRAEFNQLDFIQQKRENGASSEQLNALYLVHEQSGSKLWAESKATLQNSALGFGPAVQKALDALPANSNFNKIDATIEAATAEFISTAFVGARPEVLETSGVYRQLREQANTLRSSYYKRSNQAVANDLKASQLTALNNLYYEDGLAAVHAELRTNPSAQKRADVFDWLINSLDSGNISAEDGRKFLDMPYDFNGKKDMTLAKQFNGYEEVSKLNSAIKSARSAEHQEYTSNQRTRRQAFIDRQLQEFNQLSQDGYQSAEHERFIEEAAIQFPGETFPHLTQFSTYLDEARASKALHSQWLNRLEKHGYYPTREEVLTLNKLDPKIQDFWLKKIRQHEEIKPDLERSKKQITSHIMSNPQLTGRTSQNIPWSVSQYIEDELRRFAADVAGNPENIVQAELNAISRIDATLVPGAFVKGELKSVMDKYSKSDQDLIQRKKRQQFLTSSLKQGKVDYKDLEANLGSEFFTDLGQSLRSNTGVSSFAKYVASKLKTNPKTVYNDWAISTGKAEPITINTIWDNIVDRLPPIRQRELNTFRHIGARQQRALQGAQGAPVRNSFIPIETQQAFNTVGGPQLLMKGEGGLDSANRGMAGDTPGGIPGLHQMSVGKWKQLYAEGYNALGYPQFISSTFQGVVQRLGLPDSTIMGQEVQNLMALELMIGGTKRPTLAGYLRGTTDNLAGAMQDLAYEWASISTTPGAMRSAYGGIGNNAASISYEEASKVLMDLRALLLTK